MRYKLFASSLVPQLSRIFANASLDDKSCYVIQLAEGKTDTDLNKCITYHAASGSGYVFSEALATSTGICKVIAVGNNCARTITKDAINVSACTMTAKASGTPTHFVLGGIVPVCLTIGTDVTLLYPDQSIEYDPNGYKTNVMINAFSIPLSNIFIDTQEA